MIALVGTTRLEHDHFITAVEFVFGLLYPFKLKEVMQCKKKNDLLLCFDFDLLAFMSATQESNSSYTASCSHVLDGVLI